MAKRRWLNRELVIQRAVELTNELSVEQGGGAEISLTALAADLDIRSASLYNHIDGRDDLRRGMALYAQQQLLSQLRAAAQGRVGAAALTAMAHAYRRFAHGAPGVYPLTIRAPEPDEVELRALEEEFVQLLLLVMASAGVQGEDAIHAIRGLRALLHGFISLEAAEGYKMTVDLDESFTRMVAAYVAGLER